MLLVDYQLSKFILEQIDDNALYYKSIYYTYLSIYLCRSIV